MSGVSTRNVLARFRDNNWEQGKDFVKLYDVKKACVVYGGELERALDDVLGI